MTDRGDLVLSGDIQIVEADHSELETKLFFDAMKEGNFDVLMEFISDFADDPSAQGKVAELRKELERLQRRHRAWPDRMPVDGGIINVLPKF